MTPVVNGTVRCPDCHDRIPTTWTGPIAWVRCTNCDRTVQGTIHPLHQAPGA